MSSADIVVIDDLGDEDLDALVGQTLAERYELLRLIGAGGMGAVYLGRHVVIDKLVAVKVLGSAYAARPEGVRRFLREAKAASRIRHPNIVDITDV
jgi:serine/threonine protein kinase